MVRFRCLRARFAREVRARSNRLNDLIPSERRAAWYGNTTVFSHHTWTQGGGKL